MRKQPDTNTSFENVAAHLKTVFLVTFQGGPYMLELMDTYSGGWNLLFIALCECISLSYFYGMSALRVLDTVIKVFDIRYKGTIFVLLTDCYSVH